MKCVNCNYEHNYKFCPNCGEHAETPKITFASILKNGFSTLTNMDKGFLFNTKSLFTQPQQTVTDYLKGKRKNIYNPISFLIISITVYLIADSLIVVRSSSSQLSGEIYSAGVEAGRFIKLYFKYFWILSILWLSISTFLVFRKYNFTEHLALNAFVIGQTTLIGLVAFLIFKIGLLFNPIIYLAIIGLTYQIFKKKKWDPEIFFMSIGSTVLFFIQMFMIVVLIGIMRS